ncbi:hypothetical protein [Petropleomorpha daqingensis]|uniref:Uncharacterized protein n=1 Tax=Petropleomorpha daqingensis TaxID=2026353 RepID=A0A853CL49_9ACTN|nr:hypothetical protein [Petropleomorpha daqingensis]NYJ08297.1 hypothetical protein [Petropleomorpha daqingensis]
MIDSDAPQDDGPQAPPVPSFDSLRDPRRRSPLDLLVPPPPPAPAPEPAPVAPPRPPDYGDLLRLAVHLARWTAGIPVRGLRRLLGG